MNADHHRRVLVAGAVLAAMVSLYVLGFAPAVYLLLIAERWTGHAPLLDEAFAVLFHPHFMLCYHSEGYFAYTAWFIEAATDARLDWNEPRKSIGLAAKTPRGKGL
jgi:hypothetical protein